MEIVSIGYWLVVIFLCEVNLLFLPSLGDYWNRHDQKIVVPILLLYLLPLKIELSKTSRSRMLLTKYSFSRLLSFYHLWVSVIDLANIKEIKTKIHRKFNDFEFRNADRIFDFIRKIKWKWTESLWDDEQ